MQYSHLPFVCYVVFPAHNCSQSGFSAMVPRDHTRFCIYNRTESHQAKNSLDFMTSNLLNLGIHSITTVLYNSFWFCSFKALFPRTRSRDDLNRSPIIRIVSPLHYLIIVSRLASNLFPRQMIFR